MAFDGVDRDSISSATLSTSFGSTGLYVSS